jgi:hypothetical protein
MPIWKEIQMNDVDTICATAVGIFNAEEAWIAGLLVSFGSR